MDIDIQATHGSTSLRPGWKVKLTCKSATQWDLDPSSGPGTVDNEGNYRAPDVVLSEQTVFAVAKDPSGKEQGRWSIKLCPAEMYARFWQWFQEEAMLAATILISLLFVALIMITLLWDARIYTNLRDPSYARGVITFLIVAAAISFGLILVLQSIYGRQDADGERFRRGREVHSVLVGVMGTIVGFYFGTTGKQEPELDVAPVQVVNTTNNWKHLSTHVGGGEKPYRYFIHFEPQLTNGPANVTNALSEPGWIIYDFAWPTNVTKTVNATVAVTDKSDRQKTVSDRIPVKIAEGSQPSSGTARSPSP